MVDLVDSLVGSPLVKAPALVPAADLTADQMAAPAEDSATTTSAVDQATEETRAVEAMADTEADTDILDMDTKHFLA